MAISLVQFCVFRVLQAEANEIKNVLISHSPIFFIVL